jgi:galactose-1-phosphate uridylyltransferase
MRNLEDMKKSDNKDSLVNACDYILDKWKNYTDEKAFIYCNTDGEPLVSVIHRL